MPTPAHAWKVPLVDVGLMTAARLPVEASAKEPAAGPVAPVHAYRNRLAAGGCVTQ